MIEQLFSDTCRSFVDFYQLQPIDKCGYLKSFTFTIMLIVEITWINDILNQMSNRQMDTCKEIYLSVCCNYTVSRLQRVQLQRTPPPSPALTTSRKYSQLLLVPCNVNISLIGHAWQKLVKHRNLQVQARSQQCHSRFQIHFYSRGTDKFIWCSVCLKSGRPERAQLFIQNQLLPINILRSQKYLFCF